MSNLTPVIIGPCTLYCGDCRECLAVGLIPSDVSIVSDPPYGIAFKHSGKGGLSASRTDTIIGDDTAFDPTPWITFKTVILWGADHYCQLLPEGRWLIWDKLGGRETFGDSFSDAEVAWANKKGAMRIHRQMWKGTLREGVDQKDIRHHVSQKPVELMSWCMQELGIPEGSVVCDPYMGSGSTGVSCIQSDRRFVGVEKDENHFYIACKRIERAWNDRCNRLDFDKPPTRLTQGSLLEVANA